jgi:hypothetical protein
LFKSVPKELNSLNLIEITNAIKDIEHFIFFGTLLGMTREGEIITGDDDIDIYVDIKLRKALIKRLQNNGFIVNENVAPNLSQFFLQLQIPRGEVVTYVDFYFFNHSSEDFISEKWNFSGNIENFYKEIRIPKDLIFPIQQLKYKSTWLSIPAKPEDVCLYLYGKNWKTPLKKRTEYYTAIFNNKPIILYGFTGRVAYKLIDLLHEFKNFLRSSFSLNKT